MTDPVTTCMPVTSEMWLQAADSFSWVVFFGLLCVLSFFYLFVYPLIQSIVWPIFDAWHERHVLRIVAQIRARK